jgi:hypothetical protein
MKSKSPFAMKSPLNAYRNDQKGNYANPAYVKEEMVGVAIGKAMTKAGGDIFSGLTASDKTDSSGTIATHGLGGGEYKGFGGGMKEINLPETPDVNTNITNPNDFSRFTGSEVPNLVRKGQEERSIKTVNGKKVLTHEANADKLGYKKGTQERTDFINASTEYNKLKYKTDEPTKEGKANNYITMKGSPNKLIGDTMNINPGAVPPNQAQNDLGAQPIISADGSQPNARAIDIAAIANPYATPGADFNPQSKMKAESIFGSPMQRQGLMNLGTPLHHDSEKQSHSHPSKTTTKMKPDGEYPGARYVKGDLVDQDDLLDKTKLDAHIATQVQSDKKGTFIKEKSDDGPGSDIETSKGFGKKIRLESMGRSSYTSNMKDQLDPNDFLFKNTPKK